MHIIHIASEAAPIAKVGGLGDVTSGLPQKLAEMGHHVDLILPKYDITDLDKIRDLAVEMHHLYSFYRGEWFPNTVWIGWVGNTKVYLIEPHHPRHFFSRGCIYGCEDDVERFLYFSRAAVEFLYKKGVHPQAIHIHDWQTAAVAPLIKEMYWAIGFPRVRIVFTIHNMEYQGKCARSDLEGIGLTAPKLFEAQALQDPLRPELINLVKGGILFSDAVTTVSPTYAQQLLHTDLGMGLQQILQQNSRKFSGILNGVDDAYWNPETDRYLPAHYSSRELPETKRDRLTLANKGFLKKVIRDRLNLFEEHRPLVGCIARLVPQKGLPLIEYTIEKISEMNGQFVLLGTAPIPEIAVQFQALRSKYQDHPHVRLILHHQEELAHLIYAGSDLFIVPSLFEPCGLTQLIALRYGAVPLVRATGGLADTIFDVDFSAKPMEQRNGYVFDEFDTVPFSEALSRALHAWFEQPDMWRQLMVRGMEMDFSWNVPAKHYLDLYR